MRIGQNGEAMVRNAQHKKSQNGIAEKDANAGGSECRAEQDAEPESARQLLRDALRNEFAERSSELAEALVSCAIAGDLHSAAILMSLIELKKDHDGETKKKRSGPRLADLLLAQPEWVDEVDELAARKDEDSPESESANSNN